jgi:hypothetical protein
VLKECSVVRLLWAKGLDANDIHEEVFLVYGGQCLSHIEFHNLVEKRGKGFPNKEEVKIEVQKYLR